MYLRGCLSATLSYPLSNLLILKRKKIWPNTTKINPFPSFPSLCPSIQGKLLSRQPLKHPASLPLCVFLCLQVYSACILVCAYFFVFVCFSGNLISVSYASAGPWKAPPVWLKLAGGWSGSAAAKIPQTHRRKWQQLQNMEALPGQPVTKEKSSRYEGNVKISQIHQPCLFFVLDWQRSVCNTLKFCG